MTLTPDQRVEGAVEAKWSDRFYEWPHELGSLITFCHLNALQRATVTTRTAHGVKTVKSVAVHFVPASIYCLALGYSIVKGYGISGLSPQLTIIAEAS